MGNAQLQGTSWSVREWTALREEPCEAAFHAATVMRRTNLFDPSRGFWAKFLNGLIETRMRQAEQLIRSHPSWHAEPGASQ